MSPPLLPSPAPSDDNRRPENADDSGTDGRGRTAQQNQARRHVASEEECLRALGSLPALVALRLLTTAQANSIRGSYTAILQHYRQRASPTDRGGVADDGLIEMLTRHPEYANLLEPLLSTEQIDAILARATEGRDETA